MSARAASVVLLLALQVAAAHAAGAQFQAPVQLLPLPTIAPAPTPVPLPPPINPGPAVARPDGLSPILTQPGPLFPVPEPASPSYPALQLPGPIDQQKMRAYRNDLLNRQRQLDRAGVSPDSTRSREIQQQLNPPDAPPGPQ